MCASPGPASSLQDLQRHEITVRACFETDFEEIERAKTENQQESAKTLLGPGGCRKQSPEVQTIPDYSRSPTLIDA